MIKGTFKWNENCKSVTNCDRVIISNNCRWLKISKECFELLQESIQNKISVEKLLDSFINEDDREYFIELIKKLCSFEAIVSTDKKCKKEMGIYLVVTNRCNLKCSHCCVDAGKNNKQTDILSTIDIFSIIDKLKELNPANITVTGGEPLMRDDIFEILKYLSLNYEGKVFLMTNGLLINEDNVKSIIPYVNHIDISVDGVDEETCSSVRGKGVFNKVLDAVDLLHKNNFNKISLSMVFGPHNYYLKERFEKLNEDYKTKAIVRQFTPIGRGKSNSYLYIPESSNEQSLIDQPKNKDEIRKDLLVGSCGAIEEGFTIDYTGYIYPCSLLIKDEYILGDITKIANIKEWYERKDFNETSYQNYLDLIPTRSSKCKDCNINIFCWDCLEVMDRIKNNSEKWNKRCKIKKQMLTNIVWS